MLASQERAIYKYMQKKKQYIVRLDKEEDKELIEFINKQENKTQFFKKLLYEHMKDKG
jgi:hypothetical protein